MGKNNRNTTTKPADTQQAAPQDEQQQEAVMQEGETNHSLNSDETLPALTGNEVGVEGVSEQSADAVESKEVASPASGAIAENTTNEPGATQEPASMEAAAAVTKIEGSTESKTAVWPETVSGQTAQAAAAAAPSEETADQIIASAIAGLPAGSITDLQAVGEYMKAMRPRVQIDAATGARHQVTLYRSITNIINKLDADFPVIFAALMRLFAENADGVFHETRVFRFFEHVSLSDADRKAFQRLLNLLILLAPVQSRKQAMKQVDFERSLDLGINDDGRQRISAFFHR